MKKTLARFGRKVANWLRGSLADEAAEALRVSRAAELAASQAASVNALRLTEQVTHTAELVDTYGDRLKAMVGRPITPRNTQLSTLRPEIDLEDVTETVRELSRLSTEAASEAGRVAAASREALNKARSIALQSPSAANQAAVRAAEKAVQSAEAYAETALKAKNTLDAKVQSLGQAVREGDLPQVQVLVYDIADEANEVYQAGLTAVGAAKEAEAASRASVLAVVPLVPNTEKKQNPVNQVMAAGVEGVVTTVERANKAITVGTNVAGTVVTVGLVTNAGDKFNEAEKAVVDKTISTGNKLGDLFNEHLEAVDKKAAQGLSKIEQPISQGNWAGWY